jgi:transcriptional regulator with XRE-family HTH domain
MNIFGERLKVLRKSKGMTQTELGNKINLKLRMVQYLESGEREPNLETIKLISEIFDCTTDYILGITDDPLKEVPIKWADFQNQMKYLYTLVHLADPVQADVIKNITSNFPDDDTEIIGVEADMVNDILTQFADGLGRAIEEVKKEQNQKDSQ